tara:strand:+ start:387 stop:914 length:528 start_codon:yes stop_codon:yes gene_type:complete
MLGLGSSCNSEEGYAKGERYRERFHVGGGTYDAVTNPIGRIGGEVDYIGDFSSSIHDDNFAVTNGLVTIISNTLRVRSSSNGGHASISLSTVPHTNYKVTFINDPNDSGTGAYTVKFGTSADDDSLGSESVNVLDNGDTITLSFNSGDNANVFLTFTVTLTNKMIFFDDVSFREA